MSFDTLILEVFNKQKQCDNSLSICKKLIFRVKSYIEVEKI